MRNDLDRRAEIIAAPLLGDHALVDAARGEVAVATGRGAHEPLVVTQIQVRLGAVLSDEHLAVLERAHRARVDVDVGVELDHRDLESAGLEDRTQRSSGNPFPQRGNDTTGDEYKARHNNFRRIFRRGEKSRKAMNDGQTSYHNSAAAATPCSALMMQPSPAECTRTHLNRLVNPQRANRKQRHPRKDERKAAPLRNW